MIDEHPQVNQTTPALHDTPPTLIDCPYEGLLHAPVNSGLIVMTMIAATLFLMFVLVPNEPFIAVILVSVLVLLGALGGWLATEDRVYKVLTGVPTEPAIREALTPPWYSVGVPANAVIERLAELGCFNMTARVCKPKDMTPVQPMEVTFEPIPLDETGSLFAQLESDSAQDAPSTPRATSTLARNIRLGGGWFVLIPFSFALLMSMIDSIRLKHITGMLIQWSIMTGILVLGIGKGAWRSRFQWFLIPGGLAVRRARRWKGDWQLELYERTQSVLVVHNRYRIWTVSVASAERATKAAMTQREARMLLRAWLSPLPTPPLAQLSDLV